MKTDGGIARSVLTPEYWELVELTVAECPESALKPFRKSLIGRGHPLTASQADAAIRAAKLATWGSDKPDQIEYAKKNYQAGDNDRYRLDRARTYVANGLPVVLVRRIGDEWNERMQEFVFRELPEGHELRRLEFDDTAVDRLASGQSRLSDEDGTWVKG